MSTAEGKDHSNFAAQQDENDETTLMLKYCPHFILLHVCLALWVPFWNASQIGYSFIPLLNNCLAQHEFMLVMLPRTSTLSLTTILASGMAAIGIIDVLHVGSVVLCPVSKCQAGRGEEVVSILLFFGLGSMAGRIGKKSSVYSGGLLFGLAALAFADHQEEMWVLVLASCALSLLCGWTAFAWV